MCQPTAVETLAPGSHCQTTTFCTITTGFCGLLTATSVFIVYNGHYCSNTSNVCIENRGYTFTLRHVNFTDNFTYSSWALKCIGGKYRSSLEYLCHSQLCLKCRKHFAVITAIAQLHSYIALFRFSMQKPSQMQRRTHCTVPVSVQFCNLK